MKSASGWIKRWVSVGSVHLEALGEGSDSTSATLIDAHDLRKVPDLSNFWTVSVCEMGRQNGFIYTWACRRDAAAGETQHKAGASHMFSAALMWCDIHVSKADPDMLGRKCILGSGQAGELFICTQQAAILDKYSITFQFFLKYQFICYCFRCWASTLLTDRKQEIIEIHEILNI